MASGKQFRAQFFDVSGNYLRDYPINLTGFRKIINGGLGDLTLDLPLSFEQAYTNSALAIMNRVQVYLDNFLLYSGYIAGIAPIISSSDNKVTITCRGHASRFNSLPLKNGTQTWLYTDTTNGLTTTASPTAASLDKILKAIIDRYNAEATYPVINYTSSSITNNNIALSDTFDDNITDTVKWGKFQTGSATVAETGGMVVVAPPNATVTSSYAGYDNASGTNRNIVGGSVSVQVAQVANSATHAQTYIKTGADSSNYVLFLHENGILYAQKCVSGTTTTISSATYSASNHQWWRIRESGGTTYWETATDGSTWTSFTSTANPVTLTSAFVEIAAGTYQAETNPGTAKFDNFILTTILPTWTYKFQTQSLQYCIDTTVDNAPATWYWRVGADNIFYFKQQSTTPDVLLNFKTQISYIEDAQLVDGMINHRYFAYNGSPAANAKMTSDATSNTLYGDWWDFNIDANYTDATQVATANQAKVDAGKSPVRRMVIEVPESNYSKTTGYDIELLEPGMVVGFTNVPDAVAAVLPSTFTIAAIDYAPDSARVELNTYIDDLAREVARSEDIQRAITMDNTPTTYV